jgi:predicted CXXCH cytochrome family protein
MPKWGGLPKSRVLAAALGIAVAVATAQLKPSDQSPASNHYVDSSLCAACHQDIAASFAKTGMGRSFYRLRPQNAVETFGKPFYHQASDTYFEMLQRDGAYFQRRWQIGFDGRETNVDEKQVDYVIGSGNHVRTYTHLTSRNTLQQLPLSWYSEKGGYWAMSPGYDRPDHPAATRLVNYPCMFCHNAYPKIPAGHEEADAVPEFLQPLPEGVDCQRCHGPGRKHIEAAGRAGAKPEEIRAAILNPSRFSRDRELEVCMQCHLQTTAFSLPHSIQRLEAGPFSFIPGQPMGSFRFTFDRAGGMGDQFEIAHTAYRFRESQCFLQSAGNLRCTTCHNPHGDPETGTASTQRYNNICRNCHTGQVARNTAPAIHTANANCISCHMPKRRTDDVIHVVMTDHLIQRHPPSRDLLAEKSEIQETASTVYRGEVVPYYPAIPGANEQEASLYSAMAQIHDGSNLQAGLPRLEALLEKYHPPQAGFYTALANGFRTAGQLPKALPYFEQAARHEPESPAVLQNLGSAQMELGHMANAEVTLRRVTALAPNSAEAWGLLGQVLWLEGKDQEGRADIAKGIGIDPELPDLHSSLATLLMLKDHDSAGAEKEIREALRIRPGNASLQANLAGLLASRGETAEAGYHFQQSIRIDPTVAGPHLDYAWLLASLQQTAEARTQAEAAIAIDGNLASAHELLGTLFGMSGDVDGAIRELQHAIQLKPDSGQAQYRLGFALGMKNDRAGAIEHLKAAAAGSDPDARKSALELLQRLGQ